MAPQIVAEPKRKQAPRACRGVALHGPLAIGTRLPYCSDFIIFPSLTMDKWSSNTQFSEYWLQGREHVNSIVLEATNDRRLCEAAWVTLTKAACEETFKRYSRFDDEQWCLDVNDFGWFAANEMTAVGMVDEAEQLRAWLLDIYGLESSHTGDFPALLVPISFDRGFPCAIGALQNKPTKEPGPCQMTFLLHGKGAIKLFIYKDQAFLSGHVWCNAKPSSHPSPSNPVSLYTRYGRKEEKVLQKLNKDSRALLRSRLRISKATTVTNSKVTKVAKTSKDLLNLMPFLTKKDQRRQYLSAARAAKAAQSANVAKDRA